jgi:murein DD-endopeptidase MepM/ murein hydrolase activator NlpD
MVLAFGLAAGVALAAGPAFAFPQPKYPPNVSPSGQPPAKPAAAPSSAPAAKPAATGAKGWSIYVVQKGDTLSGVARRFGEPIGGLADLNELDRKAALKPGAKIKLPPGVTDSGKDPYASGPSPLSLATAASGAASKPLPTGVKPVAGAAAAAPNGSGFLSSAHRPNLPPQTASQLKADAGATPSEAKPAPVLKPASADGAPAVPGALDSGKGRFIWPLKGDVLLGFGPISQGQRNDGINIGGELGAEVHAAAAGQVVYAGSDVKGYGNMVLIKHADGWSTVYAHLDRIEISNRAEVRQGEVIGTVGRTGDVDQNQAQLHFETRFSPAVGAKHSPVDPMTVLPQ